MRLLVFCIILICLLSCTDAGGPVIVPENENVRIEIVAETQEQFLDRESTILELIITDGDLNPRNVSIRITNNDSTPLGALILTTGSFGTSFYGIATHTQATMEYALTNGLQTFEVAWSGQKGWGYQNEGIGYTLALRAYSEIVKWLKQNRISNPSIVISTGNSGGSMQIAYGLANYNLEQHIHHAILTGGPPTGDLDRAIFGDENDILLWPEGLGGLGITDYIMGWQGEGDYCTERLENPPNFVLERLEEESLVNNNPEKDYHYENTVVYFVNTNDVTNADQQGLLYHDTISSEKEWIFLEDQTAHNVPSLGEGAIEIRKIIDTIIN